MSQTQIQTTTNSSQEENQEIIINIPSEVNTIAIPLSMLSYFYGEYYELTELQSPVIVLEREKPKLKLERSRQERYIVLNMVPLGAIKLELDKYNNYVKKLKYADFAFSLSGNQIGAIGWLVFERTNEFYNDAPVFKLTDKEPEAYFYNLRIAHDILSCSDIKINSLINTIYAKTICELQNYKIQVSYDNDKDAYDYYIAMINPVSKRSIVDYYDTDKKRYRYVVSFFAEKAEKYRYEDLKDVPIL